MALAKLRRKAESADASGSEVTLTETDDLVGQGMNGPFHGALTDRAGFALNPRKYLFGLAKPATNAGAKLFQRSPVHKFGRSQGGHIVETPQARVQCGTILIATNGYSSEDLPDWLAARYMPTQSAVLVTRPLSDTELAAQGWTSNQMAYDTRKLLH
jgi:glycine/D-amino acid oxidase-like deaminating enzyme